MFRLVGFAVQTSKTDVVSLCEQENYFREPVFRVTLRGPSSRPRHRMTKRGRLRKQKAQAARKGVKRELRWSVAALALACAPPAFKHVARQCWCHGRCFRNRNSSRPSPLPTICPVLTWPIMMPRNSSTSTPPPPTTMTARSLWHGLPLASHAAPSLAIRASCCFPFPAHLKSASPCRRQRLAEGASFS